MYLYGKETPLLPQTWNIRNSAWASQIMRFVLEAITIAILAATTTIAGPCAELLPANAYPAKPSYPQSLRDVNKVDILKGYDISFNAGLQGHVRFIQEGVRIRYHLYLNNNNDIYREMGLAIAHNGRTVNWFIDGAYPATSNYSCGESPFPVFTDPLTTYTIQLTK